MAIAGSGKGWRMQCLWTKGVASTAWGPQPSLAQRRSLPATSAARPLPCSDRCPAAEYCGLTPVAQVAHAARGCPDLGLAPWLLPDLKRIIGRQLCQQASPVAGKRRPQDGAHPPGRRRGTAGAVWPAAISRNKPH